MREGLGCSPPRLATARHRSATVFGRRGYAVSGLRSLSRLWGGGAFALCAMGLGVRLQGSLLPDTAPLGFLVGGATRHQASAR